jgi:hypothetical protein
MRRRTYYRRCLIDASIPLRYVIYQHWRYRDGVRDFILPEFNERKAITFHLISSRGTVTSMYNSSRTRQ